MPLVLTLFSTCFLGACISQSYDEPSEMVSISPPADTGDMGRAHKVNEPEDRNQLVDFINKFNKEDAVMTPADEDFLDSLAAEPEPLSLEESALGLGLVYKWLAIVKRRGPNIEESVLPEDTSSSFVGGSRKSGSSSEWPRSLEELLQEKRVNFTRALTANAYLKSFHFQQLVLVAIKSGGGQSDSFIFGVKKALKENARVWGQLQKELEGQSSVGTAALEGGGDGSEVQEDDIAPALPFGGNTFVSDEDLLKEAQMLLDQGEHFRAVEKLKSMSDDSLFYATSLEKIKEISNEAVQDLRRKAAKVFASARPIADRKTRIDLLSEAKDFLEKAMELYPNADQIPTVEENLEVINKSLEVLNNQISQSSS